LWVVRYGDNRNPGLSFSVESISQLDGLGLGLECDIYVDEAANHVAVIGRATPPQLPH
jgi:hypothetical protein